MSFGEIVSDKINPGLIPTDADLDVLREMVADLSSAASSEVELFSRAAREHAKKGVKLFSSSVREVPLYGQDLDV
jgi:hypothetical protein